MFDRAHLSLAISWGEIAVEKDQYGVYGLIIHHIIGLEA
jgi:hypothetical protein